MATPIDLSEHSDTLFSHIEQRLNGAGFECDLVLDLDDEKAPRLLIKNMTTPWHSEPRPNTAFAVQVKADKLGLAVLELGGGANGKHRLLFYVCDTPHTAVHKFYAWKNAHTDDVRALPLAAYRLIFDGINSWRRDMKKRAKAKPQTS